MHGIMENEIQLNNREDYSTKDQSSNSCQAATDGRYLML